MQTHFSPQQLDDDQTAESAKIIRNCVHCGMCTATCPTYLLLGDERDSPRGRIYMIKQMLEQARIPDSAVVQHIDRCLGCLSCKTTCPSGVDYQHLIDHARAYVEQNYQRPLGERLIRQLLAMILPYPKRFYAALWLGRFLKPIASLLRPLPYGDILIAALRLAPSKIHSPIHSQERRVYPALGQRRARVALLDGCAQPVLAPNINAAAISLLNTLGVEVVVPASAGCCGALTHHMGRADGHDFAQPLINGFCAEDALEPLDAIVITASGCGTTIKDYGHMFASDKEFSEKAQRVTNIARDISEYLCAIDWDWPTPIQQKLPVVAYHAACSLQHGQKILHQPKDLLRRAGYEVRDIAESHICCGSAGVYNILQPRIADDLRARKVGHIEAVQPEVIATGNIGCMAQIQAGTSIPVYHIIELLSRAYGVSPNYLPARQPEGSAKACD